VQNISNTEELQKRHSVQSMKMSFILWEGLSVLVNSASGEVYFSTTAIHTLTMIGISKIKQLAKKYKIYSKWQPLT